MTEQVSPELVERRHCPFCGGRPERYTIGAEEPNNAGGDVIACATCGASTRVEFGRKENLESAWDSRAIPFIDPGAVRALRENKRQIDQDGTFVGVSHQALDALLSWHDTIRRQSSETTDVQ